MEKKKKQQQGKTVYGRAWSILKVHQRNVAHIAEHCKQKEKKKE